MDIAKIRKKAKEQQAGKRPEDLSAPQEALVAPLSEAERMPEIQKPDIYEEVQLPEPEIQKAAADARETSGSTADSGNDAQEGDSSQVELLTFSLGAEEFAFKVKEVEEILRLQKITRVPTLRSYVIGITSLRGKIIPVIDLKARLNLTGTGEAPEYGTEENPGGCKESKILIIEGPMGFIGATIDRVIGVVRIDKDRVLEPPAHLSEEEIQYIEGIVILEKRFISVLRAGETMNIGIG